MQLQENTLHNTHKMLPSTLRITYAPAEFEVAMPNSFEDDAFTKKKQKNII